MRSPSGALSWTGWGFPGGGLALGLVTMVFGGVGIAVLLIVALVFWPFVLGLAKVRDWGLPYLPLYLEAAWLTAVGFAVRWWWRWRQRAI